MANALDIDSNISPDGVLTVRSQHYADIKTIRLTSEGRDDRLFTEVPVGTWLSVKQDYNRTIYICTNCMSVSYSGKPAYCSKCGAKMHNER